MVPDPNRVTDNEKAATASSQLRWTEMVDKIRRHDPNGTEELYRVLSNGIRFYFYRQLGAQDLDDRVHDAFMIVVQAIQRGDLHEPERLMGYVRTIVHRLVASQIKKAVHFRKHQVELDYGIAAPGLGSTPEEIAIQREKAALAVKVLKSIRRRDREVLIRFYLQEQTAEEIRQEMGLTETQFRLMKSRAKSKFGELGKRTLIRRFGAVRENSPSESRLSSMRWSSGSNGVSHS